MKIGELDLFTEQIEGSRPASDPPMNIVVCATSALSVAFLFYGWRSYHDKIAFRQKQLRERVTYMLWVMVNRVPGRP